jgi:thermostable 8-oxoguanine DNA glycosylase
MRIKSSWFKEGRVHTPQEISDALSFTISRIADNALKNTRKAKFEIEVGPQYFDFLVEFTLFLILVADRIAYRELSAEDRAIFTANLANRVGETFAENRSRLLEEDIKECKQRFIDLLNHRAGEYADFHFDEKGPDYGFYRYLAFCIGEIMTDADSGWVIDQMISFEAPEAVQMVEKTLRGLYEAEPKKPRRRTAAGGD